MSFAGSLICCGIGGLFLKYGGQEAEREEIVPTGFHELTAGFVESKKKTAKQRLESVKNHFIRDFTTGEIYNFPVKGIIELCGSGDYISGLAQSIVVYGVLFGIISFVYFLTILPMYFAFFAILGPLGLVIAYVHFLLHANLLTMNVMRFTQLNNGVFHRTLERNGFQYFITRASQNPPPKRYYIPMDTAYFWLDALPWDMAKVVLTITATVFLLLISSVPIAGPILFNVLISPFIGRIYFTTYLRLKKFNNKQRKSRFYEKFGQYTAFGMVAGLLETIPVISSITFVSNSIGSALWAIEDMTDPI